LNAGEPRDRDHPSRHRKEERIEWLEVCDEIAVEHIRESNDGGEREELSGE
jgi:hypothetical protein